MRLQRALGVIGAFSLLAGIGTGCLMSSQIFTKPEGADVFVNNIYLGKSPALYTYRSGVPGSTHLRLEKVGYRTVQNVRISQVYRADAHLMWLIPGIFPYLLGTARYEDHYFFHLQPDESRP